MLWFRIKTQRLVLGLVLYPVHPSLPLLRQFNVKCVLLDFYLGLEDMEGRIVP